MSTDKSATAKSGAPVVNADASKAFFTSVQKVVSGKTFTVNAPKGITINGTRYESGSSAPVVNVKVAGWSVPLDSVRDIVRDIATALATVKGLADALTESAPSVTRGYRHEDRVAVIRAVVANGKSVTATALINAVESAKSSRATASPTAPNGNTLTIESVTDIEDLFDGLGL